MTFQWSEFGDIAQVLYTHGQKDKRLSEAANRCAISRAYYAAFHHLRIVGEGEGKKFSKSGRAHSEVIDYFYNHSDNLKQKAGNELLQLKISRSKSDYVETTTISDGNTQFSIAVSNKILKGIR
jgi:uncharacterized protein (UPF0332 family)